MGADPLGAWLAWASRARYEDLPPAVVEASKACLLNTAAAMLAGSGAPGAPEAVRQVRAWGGQPECTVVVHGLKAPAPLAAFANGVMAHAMDFDDTQVGTGLHANVSAVPALLAAAEISPAASGRDFLLAHVLALELSCRMTLAAQQRQAHPWLTTTLFGVFGAALGAGRLMGLTEPLLRQAIGIVYSSAGGNRQGLLDGTLIQRVQPGFCAQAALAAVCLARQGVTGAQDVLGGRYGLYPSYYGADYDPEALTKDLGREFRMLDLAFKPYPCCSYSQEPIEAAIELVREHAVAPQDVAEATAWVTSKHAAGLVDRAYEPRSCAQVDAQFSLQYVIAAVLARGTLGLAEFQPAALADDGLRELSRRVRVAIDPEKEGSVALRLKDGRTLSRRVPVARGHPRRPFSRPELLAKLSECARYASAPKDAAQAGAIARCVGQLEDAGSGAALAAALA